jgi:hypothetical protein
MNVSPHVHVSCRSAVENCREERRAAGEGIAHRLYRLLEVLNLIDLSFISSERMVTKDWYLVRFGSNLAAACQVQFNS